jgi:hypothetical protein
MMNMRIYRCRSAQIALGKRTILEAILLSQWRSLNPAVTIYAQKLPALLATVFA